MKTFRIARLLALWALLGTAPLVGANAPEVKTGTPAPATASAVGLQEAFVRVAQQIKPSVVTIYVERATKPAAPKTDPKAEKPGEKSTPNTPNKPAKPENRLPDPDEDPFELPFDPRDPRSDRRTSLGTGMVIRPDGYILTNFHVIKGATFVRVFFNADSERPDRASARVIGVDAESDLAVLKVDRTDLPAIEFADSDGVRIGEWSIAIGSPFDQAQSVTVGVVSAKGRHLDGRDKPSLPDYIQTDASINPGNSGGPLINLEGKVIGINTAILSPSRFNVGIGFSLPSNTVKGLLPSLMEGKRIARGFLGIQYVPLETEVAREFGVAGGMQIGALVKATSPAGKAGLQVDDIITAVDGKPVVGSDEFRRLVTAREPGAKVKLTVMRPFDEKPQLNDYEVTLGDWAVGTNTTSDVPTLVELPADVKFGLTVENAEKLNSLEKETFGVSVGTRGVYIIDTAPGSPADDAQINRGLRLVRLRVSGGEWQEVATRTAFERLEKSLPGGSRVLMQLKDRDGISVYKLLIVPSTAKAEPKTVASSTAG